jgi:hypothetical protein
MYFATLVADIDAKLKQFAVDTGRAPGRVDQAHALAGVFRARVYDVVQHLNE